MCLLKLVGGSPCVILRAVCFGLDFARDPVLRLMWRIFALDGVAKVDCALSDMGVDWAPTDQGVHFALQLFSARPRLERAAMLNPQPDLRHRLGVGEQHRFVVQVVEMF